jgi:hypothetical protein
MGRDRSKMRIIAGRLIKNETQGNHVAIQTPPALLVCEKLRPHLATLMGSGGFRSLLARALALTNAQGDWLRDVHIEADGSLKKLDEPVANGDRQRHARGGLVLVTQLLELLVAFIGENLTVRLVRDLWPTVSTNDVNSSNRGKNEEAK